MIRHYALGPVLLLALLIGSIFLPAVACAQERPRLYVFVPTREKANVVEKVLSDAMPTLNIVLFGRLRDFNKKVAKDSPAAVMAPGPTLEARGFPASIQGMLAAQSQETYALVSVGETLAPGELQGKSVGAFGIMGRKKMRLFCGGLLGTKKQKVRAVVKFTDLLSLLQFKTVAAVLLPKRFVEILTGRSKLPLVVNKLSAGQVGLTAVAVLESSHDKAIRAALNGMNAASLAMLGVESWN